MHASASAKFATQRAEYQNLKTFEGDITAAREVEARGPGQTT
jgi:hypothetical protein